jgi:hypothetical protein
MDLKKHYPSWVLVVHAYNPNYLGDRDQEDDSSRPAQAKSETLSQKYSTHTQYKEIVQAKVICERFGKSWGSGGSFGKDLKRTF